MKTAQVILGVLLGVAALVSAAMILLSWGQAGESAYESGRLAGRIFVTVILGIASFAVTKKAIAKP